MQKTLTKKHLATLYWWCVFFCSAIPFTCILFHYFRDDTPNFFKTAMSISGHSALVFLFITLGITPIRRWLVFLFCQFPRLRWGKRLSDWNKLIRFRRFFGLWAFCYAVQHFTLYMTFELDWVLEEFLYDINDRRHLWFGFSSLLLLTLLSITSFKWIIKMMKVWWRRVHRLNYLLGILATTHFYLAAKVTDPFPALYIGLLSAFLMHRILVKYFSSLQRKDDDGMEHLR